MDGNSRLIIVFFILFIRNGLFQKQGSYGYRPFSSGSSSYGSQGLGPSFGEGQSYNSQFGTFGNNREDGNRRIGDANNWSTGSSFGSSNVGDSSRKMSSSGNNSNQLNGGSGWNTGSQTDGFGGNAPNASNGGHQTYNSNSHNDEKGNAYSKKNQGVGGNGSGWNSGSPSEDQNRAGQSGKRQSSSSKEDNQRKTSSNSGSKKPGDHGESSSSDFSFNFQNEDSRKAFDSEYGGTSGLDSVRPQGTSSGSGGNSNWGTNSHSGSRRPNVSNSGSSSNSNRNPMTQTGDHKIGDFGGLGFSSSNENKNQEKPNQNGWTGLGNNGRRPQGNGGGGSDSSNGSFGFNSGSRKPQGSSTSGSNWGFGSNSDSKRPPGSTGNGGSSDWNSDSNTNSKKPQGSSSGNNNPGSGYSPTKRPNDNRQKPNSDSSLRPSSNSGGPSKEQSIRPGNTNTQPSKTTGNEKASENQKPNGNGNANPNRNKTAQVDWVNLEKENQQGSLTFDISELWHPNDKKDPAWKSIWTRNRFRREDDVSARAGKSSSFCKCMDFSACALENRLDTMKFLKHDQLETRLRMVECASMKKICCVTSRPGQEEIDPHLTCGKRVSKLAEHDISNDGLANYGDYPWILRLVAIGGTSEQTLCSASLIHSSIALTTASCALLLTGKDVRVRSGEWNVVGGHDKNKMEETTIGKVYLHPDFDVVTYTKDLALLFLNKPFHYNRGANTICLPTHHEVWDGNKCMVVGWMGKNATGLKSAVLKEVDLEIVAQGKCRHRDGLKNGLSDLEDPGFLCAHTRKNDPYLGDGGASLLCHLYNTDAVVQVGFVSNTGTEKRDHKTSTFTSILDSLDWVYRMEGIYTFVTAEDATD